MASNQYTPNDGKNGSGQGWQYKNDPSGSGRPPQKPGFNLGEWIPIIVLFCIPSGVTQLIAFFWALSKIINIVKANKEYQEQLRRFGRNAADVTRDVANAVRREVNNARGTTSTTSSSTKTQSNKTHASSAQKTQTSAKSAGQSYSYSGTGRPVSSKKLKKPKGGAALVVLGIIIAAGCGFSTLMCLLNWAPIGACVLAILTAAGLGMLGGGIKLNRRKERMLNYLAYIGTNQEADLVNMALTFRVSIKTLCKDLRYMLAKGILPTGYLDLAAGKLFLTEEGYRAPEPQQQKKDAPTPEEQKQQDDDILREIRKVNDDIPDEVMSAKIDRIEEITAKILAYQKSHPERSSQLRSFLNYYLPTTLKILRAYAQLDAQGIEGENISAAKARIEGMMDQVVAGFEKQLDKLFQDDAMDISSDVQVLENMLKKDGLSDDPQNMTMTL